LSAIGDLIKARREDIGFTQLGLAQRSGLSHRTIGHIETGERNPSPPAAVAIAEVLGISRDELFGAMKETAEYCWWPTSPAFVLPPAGPAQFPPNLEAFLIEAGVLA
jgi:transcriptional regulator with XRE-family HTH domain